ncbi:hypothetical protein L249_5345, partial [Ophiocordyceps polyrhachis-furcata BCC 54312]
LGLAWLGNTREQANNCLNRQPGVQSDVVVIAAAVLCRLCLVRHVRIDLPKFWKPRERRMGHVVVLSNDEEAVPVLVVARPLPLPMHAGVSGNGEQKETRRDAMYQVHVCYFIREPPPFPVIRVRMERASMRLTDGRNLTMPYHFSVQYGCDRDPVAAYCEWLPISLGTDKVAPSSKRFPLSPSLLRLCLCLSSPLLSSLPLLSSSLTIVRQRGKKRLNTIRPSMAAISLFAYTVCRVSSSSASSFSAASSSVSSSASPSASPSASSNTHLSSSRLSPYPSSRTRLSSSMPPPLNLSGSQASSTSACLLLGFGPPLIPPSFSHSVQLYPGLSSRNLSTTRRQLLVSQTATLPLPGPP